MEHINYIKHLNGAYQQFVKDHRLNASHISLYVALFQLWNMNRFPTDFFLNRAEVMNLAKIGSKTTYHRCIKDLHKFKYVDYQPSYNPQKGSRIKLFKFETSDEQAVVQNHSDFRQALVSNKNNYKQENAVKKIDIKEIIEFFKKNNWSDFEAKKFFNHYQSIGWIKANQKIEDWKAAAHAWILKKEELLAKKQSEKETGQKRNNLYVNPNKNYNVPL